jgi:hypothetical protein
MVILCPPLLELANPTPTHATTNEVAEIVEVAEIAVDVVENTSLSILTKAVRDMINKDINIVD